MSLPAPYWRSDCGRYTLYHLCNGALVVECIHAIHHRTSQGNDGEPQGVPQKDRTRRSHSPQGRSGGIQAKPGACGEAQTVRAVASFVGGGFRECQNRQGPRHTEVPRHRAVRDVRQEEIRAASRGREHPEQQTIEHRPALSKVPHGRGRATGEVCRDGAEESTCGKRAQKEAA